MIRKQDGGYTQWQPAFAGSEYHSLTSSKSCVCMDDELSACAGPWGDDEVILDLKKASDRTVTMDGWSTGFEVRSC